MTREEFLERCARLREACSQQQVKLRTRDRQGKFYVTVTGTKDLHNDLLLRQLVSSYFPDAQATSGGCFPPANLTFRVNKVVAPATVKQEEEVVVSSMIDKVNRLREAETLWEQVESEVREVFKADPRSDMVGELMLQDDVLEIWLLENELSLTALQHAVDTLNVNPKSVSVCRDCNADGVDFLLVRIVLPS